MTEVGTSWFSSGQFLPHGHCYLWSPGVMWMNVVGDLLIAMAYFTIPFALLYIARRRRDLSFDWLVVCFGVFVVACGLTYVMDVWNVWHAHYWLQGIVKLLTAAASVPTAILLWRFLPGILMLPSQRQLRDANESLARANRELEAFTASVSHDLRSPLTTIAGQAGLLELSMPDATDEQKRRLSRIQGSVKQMSELIEALLVLSRISRQTLHREIVDVTALAESIVQDMRQKEPARKLVNLKTVPILLMHGEASFSAPTAHCAKRFLDQAGAAADFVPLASLGIHGNGHFVMHEKNNLQVAGAIVDWLAKRVTPTEGKGAP